MLKKKIFLLLIGSYALFSGIQNVRPIDTKECMLSDIIYQLEKPAKYFSLKITERLFDEKC